MTEYIDIASSDIVLFVGEIMKGCLQRAKRAEIGHKPFCGATGKLSKVAGTTLILIKDWKSNKQNVICQNYSFLQIQYAWYLSLPSEHELDNVQSTKCICNTQKRKGKQNYVCVYIVVIDVCCLFVCLKTGDYTQH